MLGGSGDRSAAVNDPGRIGFMPGAEDELPEGPQSFTVLNNGTIVIADPLKLRLAFFDPSGAFLRDIRTGFAMKRLYSTTYGVLVVENAITGEWTRISEKGTMDPHPLSARAGEPSSDVKVGFIKPNLGEIRLPAAGTRSATAIPIYYASDDATMIALRCLGREERGKIYVLLETTRGSAEIEIRQIIRKYTAKGRLICQIEDIPVGNFISPFDEFCIVEGTVYHLLINQDEIVISEWDTKPF